MTLNYWESTLETLFFNFILKGLCTFGALFSHEGRDANIVLDRFA